MDAARQRARGHFSLRAHLGRAADVTVSAATPRPNRRAERVIRYVCRRSGCNTHRSTSDHRSASTAETDFTTLRGTALGVPARANAPQRTGLNRSGACLRVERTHRATVGRHERGHNEQPVRPTRAPSRVLYATPPASRGAPALPSSLAADRTPARRSARGASARLRGRDRD